MTYIHDASINNPNFGKINWRKASDLELARCKAAYVAMGGERASANIANIEAEMQRRSDKWNRTPEQVRLRIAHIDALQDAIIDNREFSIRDGKRIVTSDEVAQIIASEMKH